ncbi:M16 family metallopeptidase [Desulfobulbus alkaliphilus]|uniref:M16 family metallopeptidase n=1 Tax=Desulfobulbus alkaliphilus TaxID=869814 RepID=UPI001964CF77|nr:M16 family metallopeptidase [Desulfobulbus alkaliphilus]MBM9536356.1 insulinase family protein [Desulfobulbus alkaliphilus]
MAWFSVFCFFAATTAAVSASGDTHSSPTDTSLCLTSGWPQDQSDLTPDPALTFGLLENGLRYVLMVNHEPENRVALFLNVQAGSIRETEEQRGVAHYLEHMLFNGTTHYPPGTLVEYFQSIGMGFGADTNAHTSFDETVYKLILPSGEPAFLEDGFRVLADYARGALLLEEEVERERGIILAEKRSRDSAAARVWKRQLQSAFAGTLPAERDPIGLEEVIQATDSQLLRSFYDRWYRPENMIVVVVGDMDPVDAAGILTRHFDPLTGEGEVGACPEFGTVAESGLDILFFPEPELGYTGIGLTTVFNTVPQPPTSQRSAELFQQFVAISLLNRRLQQLERQPDSPLSHTSARSSVFLQRIGYASLGARVKSDRWQEGLDILQRTLAQALEYGFTAAELDRGKREISAMLEKAVQTTASRTSRDLAATLVSKLNNNEVILSPVQERDLYGPMLDSMTLEDVDVAFRDLWDRPRRLVEVVGVPGPGLEKNGAEEVIRRVFAAAAAEGVVPWVEPEWKPFPYLPLPEKNGVITEKIRHQAIGVETIVFAGGVRLNTKVTDFQANQVLFSVQFGTGRQSEPLAGMSPIAEAVVRESGVGGLNWEEMAAALAGTNAVLDFRVGPESFSLHGSSLADEIELLVQLAYTRLHDPAFRSDAFGRAREQLRQMYEQMVSTVEGVHQLQGEAILAPGSREYGLPSWEQMDRVTLEQIAAWLEPIFSQEALEINVVGDIDPEEVARLVGSYFGGEKRYQQEVPPAQPIVFPSGQHHRLTVDSSTDKALVAVAWPTTDFWDITVTRRLNVLAAVLNDRLRVDIRQELGATYSPRVISRPSRIHDGFGLMISSLTAAPDQAELLAAKIREIASELGRKEISEEELRRALEPTLTSIRDMQRTNRYWLESVLNLSHRHPQQLQWPLTIREDFSAITTTDVAALAERHLHEDMAATVIITPDGET